MKPIEEVIQIAGGQSALAKALSISQQAVAKWRASGVPAGRVIQLEKLTSKKVTRYQLRPDLYPDDELRS